ncbi:MAG: hypothetical protein JRI50_05980 [Deltaproteobacteria bacterium]|nr:hypothetical protein [Deltaproteobacteria bacterium]
MAPEVNQLNWLRWSYLPLLLSGVMAFWVGTLLAPVNGYPLRLAVAGWASLGLASLIMAALWGGQFYEPESLKPPMAISVTRLPADVPWWLTGLVSKSTIKQMSCAAVGVAAAIGGLLQFYFHTARLTMPLVILVLLGGYFVVAIPRTWLTRAAGGLVAGFALGLLPLLAGFYIQSGHWASELFLYGLPLSFSGFCVYLTQGFRNYASDLETGRLTLVTRLGLISGALVYTLANILTIIGLVLCILLPAVRLPYHQGLWLIILVAVVNQEMIKRRQYRQPQGQTTLWGLTWLVNLGMGGWFLVMVAARL